MVDTEYLAAWFAGLAISLVDMAAFLFVYAVVRLWRRLTQYEQDDDIGALI